MNTGIRAAMRRVVLGGLAFWLGACCCDPCYRSPCGPCGPCDSGTSRPAPAPAPTRALTLEQIEDAISKHTPIKLPDQPFKRFRIDDDGFTLGEETATLFPTSNGSGATNKVLTLTQIASGSFDCDDDSNTADNVTYDAPPAFWNAVGGGAVNMRSVILKIKKGATTYTSDPSTSGIWNCNGNSLRAVCVKNPRMSGSDYLVDVTLVCFDGDTTKLIVTSIGTKTLKTSWPP